MQSVWEEDQHRVSRHLLSFLFTFSFSFPKSRNMGQQGWYWGNSDSKTLCITPSWLLKMEVVGEKFRSSWGQRYAVQEPSTALAQGGPWERQSNKTHQDTSTHQRSGGGTDTFVIYVYHYRMCRIVPVFGWEGVFFSTAWLPSTYQEFTGWYPIIGCEGWEDLTEKPRCTHRVVWFLPQLLCAQKMELPTSPATKLKNEMVPRHYGDRDTRMTRTLRPETQWPAGMSSTKRKNSINTSSQEWR